MNIASFFSIVTSVLFAVLIYQRASGCRLDKLNIWSLIVCGSLAWWCLCDAFFYSAKTINEARIWHQLGAIGWCGFIPITTYYFIIMANPQKRMKWYLQLLFWVPWVILIVRCMFFMPTPLATDFVQSESGLGWTYVNSFSSPLIYVFIEMLLLYFICVFIYLYKQYKINVDKINMLSLSKGFIILDSFSILVGVFFVIVLPIITHFLPPLSFIATFTFLFGYRAELWNMDLMHIELALSSKNIFESSPNAMLMTDDKFSILYSNIEACQLLNSKKLVNTKFYDYFENKSKDILLSSCENIEHRISINLDLLSSDLVTCSINKVLTNHSKIAVYVISLNDITSLKNAQDKLEYFANYDILTGLPNRRLLMTLLEKSIEYCKLNNKNLEVNFLDLNNFKLINDTYGHNVGDEALVLVANALKEIARNDDIVSRFAGDEFIFVNIINETEHRDVKQEIIEVVSKIRCHQLCHNETMSVSVGTSYLSETEDIVKLFKLADDRMYRFKKLFKD